MELRNLMEDAVEDAINQLLSGKENVCHCDRCKLDIAAIALNNLKPKYVVTERGHLYGKVDTMNYQFDVDLIKEITKAMQIVKEHPHHGEGD